MHVSSSKRSNFKNLIISTDLYASQTITALYQDFKTLQSTDKKVLLEATKNMLQLPRIAKGYVSSGMHKVVLLVDMPLILSLYKRTKFFFDGTFAFSKG